MSEASNQPPNEPTGNANQDTFADMFQVVINGLDKNSSDGSNSIAIMIIQRPEDKKPLLYSNGHIYDTGNILAIILRDIKTQILRDLS